MKWKQILKRFAQLLVIVLIVIQFIRPEKNTKGPSGNQISKAFPVNSELDAVLKKACYDCHSNTTVYPWYSNIQPVAWWLNDHITEGKRRFNFDEFLSYAPYRQYHKLEEIDEVITEEEMPLESYTLMHRNAILDENSKEMLIQWSKSMRDTMENRYPADSLVNPSKQK